MRDNLTRNRATSKEKNTEAKILFPELSLLKINPGIQVRDEVGGWVGGN